MSLIALLLGVAIALSGSIAPARAATTVQVSGVITAATSGTPVSANITYDRLDGGRWLRSSAFVATSSAGRYELSLAPGRYRLSIQPTDKNQLPRTYPEGVYAAEANTFEVTSTDLALPAVEVYPAGRISGHVALGLDATAAGAGAIRVSYSYCHPVDGCISQTPPSTLTDANGDYLFSQLPYGSYQLTFTDATGTAYQPVGAPQFAPITIERAASTVSADPVTLRRSASVAGAIYLGSPALRAGAGEVDVTIWGPDGYVSTVTTATDGHYSFSAVPPGDYRLLFTYRGTANWASRWYGGTAFESKSSTIRLTTSSSVDATLPKGGSLTGRVVDSGDRPMSGIRVRAELVGAGEHDPERYIVTQTGTDGTYAVPGLGGGDYLVNFTQSVEGNPVNVWSWNADQQNSRAATPVTVAPQESRALSAAVFFRPVTIGGTVSCATCNRVNTANGFVVRAERSTPGTDVWNEVAAVQPVDVSGGYTLRNLLPGTYRLRVVDQHDVYQMRTVVVGNLAEGQERYGVNVAMTTGAALPPGRLVKARNAPRVYLVDGSSTLIPIDSFSSVTDLGISASFSEVPSEQLRDYSIAARPLGSVIVCSDSSYVAGEGRARLVDAALVSGLPSSRLQNSTCSTIPRSESKVEGALFLTSWSGGEIYAVQGSVKRTVLTMATLPQLSAPYPAVYLHVSDYALSNIPTGAVVIPVATLVKAADNPAVFFADGFTRLIPLPSFALARDLGIPAAIRTVRAADIAAMTVSASPLTNAVECNGTKFFGGSGRLYFVLPSVTDRFPRTTLTDVACYSLPHAGRAIRSALFLKSGASPTIFLLTDSGVRRPVTSMTTIQTGNSPDPAVWLTVDSGLVASLPIGAELIQAGALVKTASAPAVYLADGSDGLIPIDTFESVADLGLATSYSTISGTTFQASAVASDSLSNVVSCDGSFWLAANGRRWRTTSAVVGTLPVSALSSTLCSSIPAATAQVGSVAVIKSAGSPILYQLKDGQRNAIGSLATYQRLNSPYLTMNDRFVSAIPLGAPLP